MLKTCIKVIKFINKKWRTFNKMKSSSSAVIILKENKRVINLNSEYKVDLWCEFKKRWVFFGVFFAVAMAVLAPKYGAFGGNTACTLSLARIAQSNVIHLMCKNKIKDVCCVLENSLICVGSEAPLFISIITKNVCKYLSAFHSEYLSYIPLSCIYFNAGRVQCRPVRARVYILTAFHANVASMVLCAVTVNALSVAVDRRVMEGAMLASASGPCAWLSLSLPSSGVTPSLAACNYVMSLLTIPLTHLLLCGRAPVPSLEELKAVLVTAVLPYLVGTCATSSEEQYGPIVSKLSALVLLYVDCCCLLVEVEGALYVSDVISTLVLVGSWLSTVAAASHLYVKCRVLDSHEAKLLLLVATPKSTRIDWLSSTCPRVGPSRLPAVLLAPAQALLLSAIFFDNNLCTSSSLPS